LCALLAQYLSRLCQYLIAANPGHNVSGRNKIAVLLQGYGHVRLGQVFAKRGHAFNQRRDIGAKRVVAPESLFAGAVVLEWLLLAKLVM